MNDKRYIEESFPLSPFPNPPNLQTFLQELTAAVSTVSNSLLVLTLPSSTMEHFDETAEKLFQQLQKITGRTEKIYTPVEEDEIESVIRARLFKHVDEFQVKDVVDEFIEHAKTEGLLTGDRVIEYRKRFLKSYPFKPEVIDILYKRWGSFPEFQRTRGLLRLLSLVLNNILDKQMPFVRIGDFNLADNKIRREFIKFIGQEWDSIIAQDITGAESGAKKIDATLTPAYRPYFLGTVVSTSIFLMSFSGRGERDISVNDIKLSVLYPAFSSSVIDTVLSQLKEKLFYLADGGLFFVNRPNLNKIVLNKEENIEKKIIQEYEKTILSSHLSDKFKTYLWPKFPKDVPDTKELKLIVLNTEAPDMNFLEKYGESPRIYRNTMIFLCPEEAGQVQFYGFLRKLLALREIEKDKGLALTEQQKKEVKHKIKEYERRSYEELRKYYRKVYVPAKEGFKNIDLGLPTLGESKIDKEIYERLRSDSELLEKITPAVIKEKYLKDNEFVETKKLFEALLKTPGELRPSSLDALKQGLIEGVEKGIFGLGIIDNQNKKIECKFIKEHPTLEMGDGEIILRSELCIKDKKQSPIPSPEKEKKPVYEDKKEDNSPPLIVAEKDTGYSKLNLRLKVPVGQVATIARISNFLNTKFNNFSVEVNFSANGGQIDKAEYEDKIVEALKQAGIEITDVELE